MLILLKLVPKIWRGGKAPKLILQDQHYSIQIRKKTLKEKKLQVNISDEYKRVTGRQASFFQMEEIDCKRQTFFFFFFLSSRKKQTKSGGIFFLLLTFLYKIERRFLLNSVLSWQHLVLPELNFSQTLS